MIKTRMGLFETNSSSMHSIVITHKNDTITKEELLNLENLYLDKNNLLRLYGVEHGFGREFNILYTFQDKIMYALCEYCGRYYGDDPRFKENYNMILEIVQDIVPEVKDFYIHKKYLDVYLDKNGDTILHKDLIYFGYDKINKRYNYKYIDKNDGEKYDAIFDDNEYIEYPGIGMIDHQSMGLLSSFIKKHNITLKEFLINKKYVIIIDGDEIEMGRKLIESGVYIMDIENSNNKY